MKVKKTEKGGSYTMTAKRNSMVKLMTVFALSMMLCLSMVLPSFAEPDKPKEYSEGIDSGNPAKAAITKIFKIPSDVPNPKSTFTFKFTAVGMDDGEDTDGMPVIPEITISFEANENSLNDSEENDYRTVVKESADILSKFKLDPTEWIKGEGVYKYTVEEIEGGIPITDSEKEEASYSKAKYEIEIWVEKDKDGKLFARFVNAKTVTNFIDEYYSGEEGGKKVNPTPGGVNQKPEISIEDDFSQVIFSNRYWKTDGGGEKDPTLSALDIIKNVAGNGANRNKYFDFTVKVIQPSLINKPVDPDTNELIPRNYKAYVMDKNGNIVTDITADAKNGVISGEDSKGGYFLFTSNQSKVISLKDGQKLVFVDLHVGSKVEVEEAAAEGYLPKYERTFGKLGEFPGEEGKAWGFPRTPDDPASLIYTIDGVNANTATFTNTRTGATPTGISVDELPYIVMVGVALAGLVAFVAVKYRRKDKY